jgi:transcriptional regulator with GAF, ATPase, and Fis domain
MEGVHLFARIARELAEQPDHARAVQRLAQLAVQLVGCDVVAVWEITSAGTTVLRAATDSVSGEALDSILTGVDEGIAHQALATRSTVLMQDLTTEQRWPNYRAAILERNLPICSAVVYSLDVGDSDLGALALYSTKPHFFSDERLVDIGGVLADHAAIALDATFASDKANNLQSALESNRKIGMAIGILMAEHRLTEQQAFDLLRTASQRNHVKLREIADRVVLTGATPTWSTTRRPPN